MHHTNYKQMIEIKKDFKKWFDYMETADEISDWWIDKLKSQAIKSLNNEIEYLESKKIDASNLWFEEREEALSYNKALQDHISYLLAQRKEIEEDI